MTTSMLSDFDAMVAEMIARKIPRDKAVAAAHAYFGTVPKSELEKIRDAAAIAELEDDIVDAGDRLMAALGFVPIRMSQKRASKLTPGVPDRYYVHPKRHLALWWEAKTATGRARPEQMQIAALFHESRVEHVLGPLDALQRWLTDHQVATFDDSGLPTPIPFDG